MKIIITIYMTNSDCFTFSGMGLYDKDPECCIRGSISHRFFEHKVAEFLMTRNNAKRFVGLMQNAFGPQNMSYRIINDGQGYDIYIPYELPLKDVDDLNVFQDYFISRNKLRGKLK